MPRLMAGFDANRWATIDRDWVQSRQDEQIHVITAAAFRTNPIKEDFVFYETFLR